MIILNCENSEDGGKTWNNVHGNTGFLSAYQIVSAKENCKTETGYYAGFEIRPIDENNPDVERFKVTVAPLLRDINNTPKFSKNNTYR